MVSGGKTPILSSSELHEMGFSIGIHPALGFLAAGEALKNAYAKLDISGNVDGVELEDFERFSKLMGFEDVWEFENKWSDF
jgi:2-methylisocitrate lyase-like PEP mutase family enzyme